MDGRMDDERADEHMKRWGDDVRMVGRMNV